MNSRVKKRARSDSAKLDRKEILLETSLGLFAEKGFSGTKIENITSASGLSTGTFYLYFAGKSDIYQELYSQGMELLINIFDRVLGESGISAPDKLVHLAKSYFKFYHDNHKYFRILYVSHLCAEKTFLTNDKSGLFSCKTGRLLESIREIIVSGIESGELKTGIDPWEASAAFLASIDGILFMNEKDSIRMTPVDHKKILMQALEIITAGMRN